MLLISVCFDFLHNPTQEPKARQESETKRAKESKESDDLTMEVANEVHEAETFTREAGHRQATVQTPDTSDSDEKEQKSSTQTKSVGSDGGAASVSGPSKLRHRTACPYGKECYRYDDLQSYITFQSQRQWKDDW